LQHHAGFAEANRHWISKFSWELFWQEEAITQRLQAKVHHYFKGLSGNPAIRCIHITKPQAARHLLLWQVGKNSQFYIILATRTPVDQSPCVMISPR
jgi:hypothetical protein